MTLPATSIYMQTEVKIYKILEICVLANYVDKRYENSIGQFIFVLESSSFTMQWQMLERSLIHDRYFIEVWFLSKRNSKFTSKILLNEFKILFSMNCEEEKSQCIFSYK